MGRKLTNLPDVFETGVVFLPIGGRNLPLSIVPAAKPMVRQRLMELRREAEFNAEVSGNQSVAAYALGATVGGGLATGGIVIMATSTLPITIALVSIVGIGVLVTAVGLTAGYWLNNVRAGYKRDASSFEDAIGELDR